MNTPRWIQRHLIKTNAVWQQCSSLYSKPLLTQDPSISISPLYLQSHHLPQEK